MVNIVWFGRFIFCRAISLFLDDMTTEESFEIHLPQFEGPFDLLLFFIERDELDIHDIPIARLPTIF